MPDLQTGASRPRRRRWRWALLGVGALVLLVLAQLRDVVYDMVVLAPWAWPPGPVLTTSWVGVGATPGGSTVAMHLDLERSPRPSSQSGFGYAAGDAGAARIEGTGRFCSDAGPPVDLTVTGFASRTPDDLRVTFVVPQPPSDGLSPTTATGAWDGGGRLDLTADLTVHRAGAGVSGPDAPDSLGPTTIELRPGPLAELDALCPPR